MKMRKVMMYARKAAGFAGRSKLYAAIKIAAVLILVANVGSALFPAEPALADNPAVYFLEPVADAHVDEGAPNSNFGTTTNLRLGPAPEFGYAERIFLRFETPPLPDDAVIDSARLYLYLRDAGDYGGEKVIALGRVLASWQETGAGGITWNNQPAVSYHSLDSMSSTLGWKWFDVTQIVRGWVAGTFPNHGIMLRDFLETDLYERIFYSRESARCRPYLEISYTTGGEAPAYPPLSPCGPSTDSEPPELTITADPDPAVAGESLSITARATDDDPDDTGVYRLQLLRGSEIVDDRTYTTGPSSATATDTITPDAGTVRYSALAWDQDMNPAYASILVRVYMDGTPPSITVEHEPENPAIGETVTFRARATDDSGVDHIAVSINGVYQDRPIDPPDTDREVTVEYEPGDRRVIRYFAYATDQEGFYNSTGTQYVFLGDTTGPDTDGDHLSDEIEDLLGIDPNNNDTDGDGLYDGWEVLGFDRGWDGTVEVDLPALGATPHQRDVFVEVDWMESTTNSYALHPVGVQAVVNAYSDYALRLHVDTGQLGGGNAVPWVSSITDQWGWFNATKRDHFDPNRRGLFYYVLATPHVGPKTKCGIVGGREFCRDGIFILRRATGGYATPARHAELFMHELGHGIGLGHGGQREVTPYTVYGLGPDGTATTFTLDWALDNENNKPHYFSNMNYRYQFELKVLTDEGDDVYLYSYHAAPTGYLDETALDEDAGYEATVELGHLVWRRCRTTEECETEWYIHDYWLSGTYYLRSHEAYDLPIPEGTDTCLVHTEWFTADGSWIDWDFDGVHDPPGLEYDVNQRCGGRKSGDGEDCSCEELISDELVAPYEIPLLQPKIYGWESDFSLTAADATSLEDAAWEVSSPEPNEAPPLATDGEHPDGIDNDGDGRIDEGLPDKDKDGIADMIDNCPWTSNPDQIDSNQNHIGDDCEGPPDAPTGLSVQVVNGKPTLAWKATLGRDIVGYNVYRKDGAQTGYRRLDAPFPTAVKTPFEDEQCVNGATYAVSTVNVYMKESAFSETASLGSDVCPAVVFPVYLPIILKGE